MNYSIKHLDADTHKSFNFTKDYIKSFENEIDAFIYLAEINERQSFCYGQKDFFNDIEIQKRFEMWRKNLNISQFKNLTK